MGLTSFLGLMSFLGLNCQFNLIMENKTVITLSVVNEGLADCIVCSQSLSFQMLVNTRGSWRTSVFVSIHQQLVLYSACFYFILWAQDSQHGSPQDTASSVLPKKLTGTQGDDDWHDQTLCHFCNPLSFPWSTWPLSFNSKKWLKYNFSILYPHTIQQTDNENTQTYQLKSVTWSNANFS